MPQESPFDIDIPACNILDYLFPTESEPSDEPIWIDADNTERNLSPKHLLLWAKRLGLGLQQLGLDRGDVVMVYSSNHLFVPVAYCGIAGAGYIFSGCNPAYGVEETVYQIENTGAKAIFVDPALVATLLKAASNTNFPHNRIFLFSDTECSPQRSLSDWRSILAPPSLASTWRWPSLSPQLARTTTAVLNYSSGTTGLPKGVMITHQNIIANTAQSLYMRDLEQPYTPSTRPPERWLGFLPLYHAYGQLWSISAAAKSLTPTYIMRASPFSFPAFLRHISTHRITHLQTAPPVVVMLAKRLETMRDADTDIRSLRNILCGAAPLSAELQNEVADRFGVRVVQTWGMTELTCSAMHVPGGRDDRSGSVGYADPNCEVKLVDDEGREEGGAAAGGRGEVCVRGPNVCLGYWRNEGATREAFDEDGFLRTGDVAVRDEGGRYWIVDRKKELIKVKGFQVAPAEMEAVLLENEAVADAAVVGVQTDHEELPRAYVVLKDHVKGGKVSEEEIASWTARRVAKHKQLLGGIVFIEEVPKSPSGKIQRKIVREWAKRDAEVSKRSVKARL
ncbi:4-coumarate-ligase [Diplodia corticola]|uniref:4-coumarate-ligase n=1 Tax=Diplodia corticola TaxID=236234 RepID=A0A1J9RXE9_9PEZI|nr:4-coumarate-ligase [Diplodia corticola]OJD33023.1 4-coumarate-ligase [Diplodia corticola]